LAHQRGGGREGDREAFLASGESEREGNVGLAGAAIAKRDDILAAQDVLAAGELQHQHLVEAGNGGEVERVEAFDGRKPSGADPSLDGAALAVDKLELDEPEQIARVVDVALGAFAGHLLIFTQHGGQLELLEMVRKEHLRRAAHRADGHAGLSLGHAASTA